MSVSHVLILPWVVFYRHVCRKGPPRILAGAAFGHSLHSSQSSNVRTKLAMRTIPGSLKGTGQVRVLHVSRTIPGYLPQRPAQFAGLSRVLACECHPLTARRNHTWVRCRQRMDAVVELLPLMLLILREVLFTPPSPSCTQQPLAPTAHLTMSDLALYTTSGSISLMMPTQH